MFLYPDGRLQEAGGIIFSDASGWNYGRLDLPTKPEYLFSREVDYISGACLMFRKSDWDDLGGFDSHFAPAYYEDTDLCFSMRKKGLSTCYVPSSKVIHFEGVSNGTDESSGMKRYQVINKAKFQQKWHDVLKENHFESSDFLFQAREHGKTKKTILVIDHYVPMFDKDAGSRSTFMYLKLFIEEGYKVIFMGDNFYPHQPYTEILQNDGVEVLYGDEYQSNWLSWLENNITSIDVVYIHRPHIAKQYIDKIRSIKFHPKIVYFGHDLHFLRLQREEELSMKNTTGKTIEEWKSLELDVMKKSDVALYPSDFEVNAVKSLDPMINVDSIPLNWFDASFDINNIEISKQPNLLFVGGFGHPPNKDGLMWFLQEIFPEVVQQVPNVKLTIIGSKCPKEIFSLANANISVLGEVSDELLKESYENARIAIVPLRYGAGVKGKILESMSYGVPVVTTPIGAEGLPENQEDYLSIANSSEEFTKIVVQLVQNEHDSRDKAKQSFQVLKEYFSKDAAKKLINHFNLK